MPDRLAIRRALSGRNICSSGRRSAGPLQSRSGEKRVGRLPVYALAGLGTVVPVGEN